MFSIARRVGRVTIRAVPTLLTLAALGGVAWWGARNEWRIPSAAAPTASDPSEAGAIRVAPGPSDNPTVRAHIAFASAADVRRAGLQFAPARTQALSRFVTATGSVGYDPGLYAQLSARAAGTVWWVEKVPGQPVAPGEVLALIEALEVGRAKSDLVSTLRMLEKQTVTLDQLREAGGAVAGRTVREAQAAVDDARLQVMTAQQALLNLGLDVRYQDLQTLSVEDRLARLQYLGLPPETLERIRGKTQSANLLPVRAPFAGAMVRRTIAQGETVTAGKPLFVVASTARVHLELALDPAEVREIRLGQEVRFVCHADPEFEARGVLAHLVPEVDEATRKVWAHAEADNPGGRLKPNTFGRGRVVVAEVPAATVVPESALQPDGEGWVVFVRDGDAAFQARRTRPGLRGGGLVQVDGVAPGEEVVTVGSHALQSELQRDKLGGGGD
jgi:cobalt-zinc-cadmium efflux system membrane fusion protein